MVCFGYIYWPFLRKVAGSADAFFCVLFERLPEKMKINTDESSGSEDGTDEDDDAEEEDGGGLSDESANKCLKSLEAENKLSQYNNSQDQEQVPSRGHRVNWQASKKSDQSSVSLIDLEEQTAEECEAEELSRKKKKKHR